jgi:hypothetical protein
MKTKQMILDMPKDKKATRLNVMLDSADICALETCMRAYGETSMSSFVRRLIHEAYRQEKKERNIK